MTKSHSHDDEDGGQPPESATAESVSAIDAVQRVAKRIVRAGVYVGIGGFVITFIGAVLLGNGPSQWEQPGNVLHRGGMFLMLAGFFLVLIGYRWKPLVEFLASRPQPSPSPGETAMPRPMHVRDLLDTLPGPPHERQYLEQRHAEAHVSEPRESAPQTGAAQQFASSFVPPGDAPAAPNEPAQGSASWGPHRPMPPGRLGCLVACWCVVGSLLFLLGIPYWLAERQVTLLISTVFDSLLLVVAVTLALELPGRLRGAFIALTVGTALTLWWKVTNAAPVSFITPFGRPGYGDPWSIRIQDIVIHLGIAALTLFGLLVSLTLEHARRPSR